MARSDKVTIKESRNRYDTEDACREVLFRLRFPGGFICPRCDCREFIPPAAAIPVSAVPAAIRLR